MFEQERLWYQTLPSNSNRGQVRAFIIKVAIALRLSAVDREKVRLLFPLILRLRSPDLLLRLSLIKTTQAITVMALAESTELLQAGCG